MKLVQRSMLVIVCLLSAAITLEAAWTQKRITNNTGESCIPTVAANGSNVCVVWQDSTFGGNDDIYFRMSTDKGATWQPQKRLTNNTGPSLSPMIVISGANIYVVWYDHTPGNPEIYFRRSTDYGATWQTAKRLTDNTGSSFDPKIAVSGANVYVVWYDNTFGGNFDIYLRRSTDYGATWQTQKRLTNNTGDSNYPAIAADGSNVYVVWYDATFGGNDDIYFRKSTDYAAAWQTQKRLTNNTGTSWNPKIVATGSNVYVVWHDDTTGLDNIYFKKSTDGSATWPTTTMLTNTATGYCGYPSLAVYLSNVYVVYENSDPGNVEIFFKKSGDGGATWPTTKNLSNTAAISYWPDIALGGGKVYVVYQDIISGNNEIFLKYSPL